jgi:acetyl-CoA carboxylase biotin carboxyl carrier protein
VNVARGREATAEVVEAPEAASGAAGEAADRRLGAQVAEVRAGAAQPMIDLEFVKGLIEAVDNSGIDSLEVTRAGTRVKISKTPPSAGPAPAYFAAAPAPASGPAPPAPAGEAAAPAAGGAEPAGGAAEAAGASGLLDVTSPMVGTFYRAPAPEAPAYVEVGTRVTKGQTLCILEAMKLMNELESEVEGVVREILVDNAEPVEYGQVLFRIDPNG